LSAHKGEVAAQLQQEVFQALDQGFFKLVFGIRVLEVQELRHVGVFDGFVQSDGILRFGQEAKSEQKICVHERGHLFIFSLFCSQLWTN
jgi:hypothetical protein